MVKYKDEKITMLILSIIFFEILFVVSILSIEHQINFEPIHVFIALIPLIIVLIFSGKLEKVVGPGGISILLRDEAQKRVYPELTDNPLAVDPVILRKKGGIDELQDIIAHNPPNTLSFELEKKNYYKQSAIKEYISALGMYSNFRFILFTDRSGKFKGLMNVGDYKNLLQTRDIVQILENSQILEDLRVIKNSIETTSTNKQALDEMVKLNANMLPVVREGNFVGVVTQESIVRKILTKLLQEA